MVKVLVVPLLQWVPLRGVLTVKCLLLPLRKPWLLPERLLTSLSGKTTSYSKSSLFIVNKLHGLDPSAKNFRAEEDFKSMLFLSIDGIMAIINEKKSR